jgi:hypothetical protein
MADSTNNSCEQQLADAYCKLLNCLDWSDPVMVAGIREGLNKFLSNAFLGMFPGTHKYHRTHLVSPAALRQLEAKDYRELVYEHVVPKSRYIQRPCEERAARGELTTAFVQALLEKYWRVATVTKAEDAQLHRFAMPDEWDGVSILARYQAAGVELLPNPYYCGSRPV